MADDARDDDRDEEPRRKRCAGGEQAEVADGAPARKKV